MVVPQWIDLGHVGQQADKNCVVKQPPTRRHIIFHYRANRSCPVHVHSLLTLGPPFFPLQPFALALLTENSLQIFRSAARIFRISSVLEWTRGRQDGQLLRESLKSYY